MKINCFSITIWFNIYDDFNKLISSFQSELSDEFPSFQINKVTDNLLVPVILANNKDLNSTITVSQINLQYTMNNKSFDDIDLFKDHALKLLDILINNDVKVCHSSVFVNSEISYDDALHKLTSNTLNESLKTDSLVDCTLKFGKKSEDLFYKIINIFNKKQIKIPKSIDEKGRVVPLPLISLNGCFTEGELLDISYEINDKYSYDFTKNYTTNDFYLNKMLYILKRDYLDDINNLLDKGEFN